jgi:hypothetical protein
LRQGSITVKVGDAVKAGAPIAKLVAGFNDFERI